MNKVDRWTLRDEAELSRLLERKERLTKQNMEPLIAKLNIDGIGGGDGEISCESIAKTMAANADQYRDLLEPFDSGFRAEPAPEVG